MKVLLLDSDTLIWLSTFNKKEAPIKSLEDCINDLNSRIEDIFNKTGCTHYIFTLTTGKTNFRYTICSEYKAKRSSERPNYFKEVKDYLIEKYEAIYHNNYESDDLILTSYKLLISKGVECIVSSPDKDIKKLELTCYDYKKNEWTTTTAWEACEYFFRSMIVGDNSDGISGLKGLGDKWVDKLFEGTKDYPEKVLSNYIDYYKSVDKGIEEYYKTYKLLKIVDNIPGFELPELIEFKPIENEERISGF